MEVWSVRQGRWLHADSCEGLIDRPNMYEQVGVLVVLDCYFIIEHISRLLTDFNSLSCTGMGKETKLRHRSNP